MNFKPRGFEELTDPQFINEGIYDFVVKSAWDKQSKSGKQSMIELKVRVTDGTVSKTLTDYLHGKRMLKLRNACECMGLLAKYDIGSLVAADFTGKRGKCEVGVEVDKNGVYPQKNVVLNYLGSATGMKALGASNDNSSKIDAALALVRKHRP